MADSHRGNGRNKGGASNTQHEEPSQGENSIDKVKITNLSDAMKQNKGLDLIETRNESEDIIVYIKGLDVDITQKMCPYALENDLEKQFKPVKKIEKAGKSLRIFCATQQQKNGILKGGIIGDCKFTGSEPYKSRNDGNKERGPPLEKVVIVGVPTSITDDLLSIYCHADSVRRIKKKNRTGRWRIQQPSSSGTKRELQKELHSRISLSKPDHTFLNP